MTACNLTITELGPRILITQAGSDNLEISQDGGSSVIITPDCGGEIVITEDKNSLVLTEQVFQTVVINDGQDQTLVITETVGNGDGCGGCPDYAGASTDANDGTIYYFSWTHKDNENDFAAQRYNSETKVIDDLFGLVAQPATLSDFQGLNWP